MKIFNSLILTLLCGNIFAQELKIIDAKVNRELDFGPEIQKEWAIRDRLMKDLEKDTKSWDQLTELEHSILKKYGEVYDSMWDVIGGGCSWYCGAGGYKVTTSSELSSQGNNSYNSENLKDFSFKTAWVEGVDGYGIGEYIEYSFEPTHPRLTKIFLVNGYVKSKKAWKNNSRVKKIKMYLNDIPYAIINLKNIYSEQYFEVDPIGHSDRKDVEKLKQQDKIILKFEILEVYKGEKYDDTAITEIYFDGIDVH